MNTLSDKDKIIIAKRLRTLREEKGLSYERLHQELIKNNIKISVQALKDYEVENKYHSKFNSTKGMKLETLYNLARFYSVSTDYILGLTDIKSPDMRVKPISEFTGLSETAIEKLNMNSNYYRNNTYPLSEIVSHESLTDLLNEITNYKKARLIKTCFERIKPAIIDIINSTYSFEIKKYCIDSIINHIIFRMGGITLRINNDYFFMNNPHLASSNESIFLMDYLDKTIDNDLKLFLDAPRLRINTLINDIVDSVTTIDKDSFVKESEEFAIDVYNTISQLGFRFNYDGSCTPMDNHPFVDREQIERVAEYLLEELKNSISDND